MSHTLPTHYAGQPLPAEYLAMVDQARGIRVYETADGEDVDFYLPARLCETERNGLPYYARLSDPEFYFKATETRSDGPQLSLEEMQQGFTIGSYNEGHLFLLPNQSVWLIYSDLFYQKIADHFSQWFAGLSFSFEAGGED
ncbi:hypothetical protein [Eikenella corrodens]|uniref:hypothetical protein n=1 Tax=Eikenella corrodens TaxID=539 RepID=UPI000B4D9FF4|nr:hypothetical protein [Eikenella corrodens]OWP26747.1 hypothetical protein CA838_00010 [Eikenella corrodens]